MSNANRDYAIVYDVKNSSLVLSRPLNSYITDKNTSNIFIRLVTRISVGDGIDQYTDIEEATNYILTMRVIKPNNEVKSIEATQHEPESIFQFDLTEDFKDIPGEYICELTISTAVNSRQELITSDPFSYEVKRSILSNVGEIIETEDVTVEKLLNDLGATKSELSSQIKEIADMRVAANGKIFEKAGDRLNYFDEQLDTKVNKVNLSEVNVKDFGAKGDGVSDDTQAFNDAIAYIELHHNANTLYIPRGEYIISETLQIPSGLHLKGAGRDRKTQDSTALKRKYDKTLLQAKGMSILEENSTGHIEDFIVEDIKLVSNDFKSTPMVDFTCAGNFRIKNCFFFGQGTQLLLWEAFDSRITDTDFEWGGDAATKLPAIELRSTNGGNESNPTKEYTNEIHFVGCRFESYPGYAIKTTGINTNEIFLTNCKFESIENTIGHFWFEKCSTLLFKNVQWCLGGNGTSHGLTLKDVSNSNIDINFEVSGFRRYNIEPINIVGDVSSNIFNFQTSEASSELLTGIDCFIKTDLTPDMFNNKNVINMYVGNITKDGFKHYPIAKTMPLKDTRAVEITSNSMETGVSLRRTDLAGYWDIGRVDNNGNFRFVRNDGSKEIVPIQLTSSGEIYSYKHHHFKDGMHLFQTSTPPWTSGNGTMYVDITNTIPTLNTSINGNYRKVSYSNAIPTEGNWTKGTIIYNTNVEIGQPIGWVCTVSGAPGTWCKFGTIEVI